MRGRIAIFIPAFNEEQSIGSVVALARECGPVLVVDDGSSDSTARAAKAAGASVVSHPRNMGYGAALKTIFAHARKAGAAASVVIDGDFQHDPLEIPRVASPVLSGKADVSIGSRFLGRSLRASGARLGGVRLLNSLSSLEAGSRAVDFQCGFRAFSRRALGKIAFQQGGYGAGAEIAAAAFRSGLRVAEVPVSVRYFGGRDKSPLEQGAGIAGHVLSAIAARKPLMFFAGTGAALLLASAVLGVFVADTYYSRKIMPFGSAFLTVFFGIAGMVMISIGINLYTLETVLNRKKTGER